MEALSNTVLLDVGYSQTPRILMMVYHLVLMEVHEDGADDGDRG